ncbi:ribosomal maturation YjgA family protein [Pedobacter caeni]|uniref:ribosomal maturation YjgA family protein n=1 Tax=Pedobacter caeni TaxID=288992 RepID=UPI000932164C|nr:DUF2809 domain-containing protein [Pedobacter caeni]
MKSQHTKIRFKYALFILIVIAAGILSRKTPLIPLIVGDLLYAVMMFLIIRFLFIRLSYLKTAFISLSICYLIELSQLYDATWFNSIRNTTFGGLVLGHGFLWGDMAAYTLGTAICVMLFQKIKPFTPVN